MTLITWSILLKIIQLVKQILKKKQNELNELKNVETKGKELIKSQYKLLSLFDDLKTILNSNNDRNNSASGSNSKNESKMKMWMRVKMAMKMRMRMMVTMK